MIDRARHYRIVAGLTLDMLVPILAIAGIISALESNPDPIVWAGWLAGAVAVAIAFVEVLAAWIEQEDTHR